MTRDEMVEVARANIDSNLGNAADPDDPNSIAENAYVLAFDALHDRGVDAKIAREIASHIAAEYRECAR